MAGERRHERLVERVATAMCEHLATVEALDMDNAGDGESVTIFTGGTPQTAKITINMNENAMRADNPADGWKEIIDAADAAINRARATGGER